MHNNLIIKVSVKGKASIHLTGYLEANTNNTNAKMYTITTNKNTNNTSSSNSTYNTNNRSTYY